MKRNENDRFPGPAAYNPDFDLLSQHSGKSIGKGGFMFGKTPISRNHLGRDHTPGVGHYDTAKSVLCLRASTTSAVMATEKRFYKNTSELNFNPGPG